MKVDILVGSRDQLRIDYLIRLLYGEVDSELRSLLDNDELVPLISGRSTSLTMVAPMLELGFILGLRRGRIVFYDPDTLSSNAIRRCFSHEIDLGDSLDRYQSRVLLKKLRAAWPGLSFDFSSLEGELL